MRLLYQNKRPTRLGRWFNRINCWWSGLGLPPRFQAVLEIQVHKSGRIHANPVVIPTVNGKHYLVSMLDLQSDWVQNIEAAHGKAVIRQGRRSRVHPHAGAIGTEGTHLARGQNRAERPQALSHIHRHAIK